MENNVNEYFEKRMESLKKDEKQCEEAMKTVEGRYSDNADGKMDHTSEYKEYAADLEKIKAEIEKVDKEKDQVQNLYDDKEEVESEQEKLTKKIESLEKDKKQCEEAMQAVEGRYSDNTDGKMDHTSEYKEYAADLEKINSELEEAKSKYQKSIKSLEKIVSKIKDYKEAHDIKEESEKDEKNDTKSEDSKEPETLGKKDKETKEKPVDEEPAKDNSEKGKTRKPWEAPEIVDAYRTTQNANTVSNKKPEISKDDQIRIEMAKVLGIYIEGNPESYKDVEKKYEHDIQYQLDDYEVDKFQELKAQLGKGEPKKDDKTQGTNKGNDDVKGKEEENHQPNDDEKDITSFSYEKKLEEYKMSLEMYNQDLEQLYDLQNQLENGKVQYDEYEKHAKYMVGRYKFIKGAEEEINKLYEIEKAKQEKLNEGRGDGATDGGVGDDVWNEWDENPVPKDVEKPEKPEQPMMVVDKGKGKEPTPEPIPGPTPEKKGELIKSGLQIFREQFNQMPDIRDKHTAAERVGLVAPVATGVGAALIALNPIIGVPIIAGSLAAKPIVKKITGQSKLEKQITEQFNELYDKNPQEFRRMVDYLSEEKIQDIKPNATILHGLHKSMIRAAKKESERLDIEKNGMESIRDRLLKDLESGRLSPEQARETNAKLGKINARLLDIEENEAPRLEKELKDVKRGKDRVSVAYKGNLRTRFNIFAHRNSTTEEYADPINDLADAELARDKATLEGNHAKAAKGQQTMDQVMNENTYTNRLGIQTSVFNSRGEHAVRVISDKHDNTIRYAAIGATALTGLAVSAAKINEYDKAQEANEVEFNKMKQNQQDVISARDQITRGDVQNVADGNVTRVATAGETAAERTARTMGSAEYRNLDQHAQDLTGNAAANSTIGGTDKVSWLRQLANQIRGGSSASKELGEASQKAMGAGFSVDHTTQLGYTQNAEQQTLAEADLFEKFANLFAKIGNGTGATFKHVNKSFLGPIISAIATGMAVGKDAKESRKEGKYNKEMQQENDEK